MRQVGFRRLLAAGFVVLFGLLAASHGDDVVAFARRGLNAQTHHHGPFTPCPDVKDHHCLACAVSVATRPQAAITRLAPPEVRRAAGIQPVQPRSVDRSSPLTGRSPPA